MNNYNKVKVMTTYKITRITFFITKTTKPKTTKTFPLFQRQHLLKG